MSTAIEMSDLKGRDDGSIGSGESDFSNDDGAPNTMGNDDDASDGSEGDPDGRRVRVTSPSAENGRDRHDGCDDRGGSVRGVLPLLAGAGTNENYASGAEWREGKGANGERAGGGIIETYASGGGVERGKDDGKELGRHVRFYVDRLDGKDGKGGEFVVQLHPSWAPAGVKRFEELTEAKFWDDCRVFRVVTGFVSQWGISGDPEVSAEWRDKTIPDDKVRAPNRKGTITFATSGEDSRTTQVFVNLKNNARLDKMGFSPIGEVVEGMQVVNHFYSSYGEGAPNGHGPDQSKIQNNGNSYLDKKFPKLSYFKKAEFVD
eukprot:CAMPEP_0183293408 /NCGR_PEP_ID=MMETSP0160_2-20130417/2101_1 /TAXON_ID=2839 ORGANISM="Odontella Sinensis, Strain Grunow 1884" /NCGR_SAMPLE_ID=MMETSP0160_2 /ASSEMBLY_ACC=CAM_ASM_000250 /LENGTH=317 /DNA_ID=CAMNT_0025454517 /DNA_START=59 /DNA_END=1013 /DNA_ORIENTATION=+